MLLIIISLLVFICSCIYFFFTIEKLWHTLHFICSLILILIGGIGCMLSIVLCIHNYNQNHCKVQLESYVTHECIATTVFIMSGKVMVPITTMNCYHVHEFCPEGQEK